MNTPSIDPTEIETSTVPLWPENQIPFAVAERIVIARMISELDKAGGYYLTDLSLRVERGINGKAESNYGFWLSPGSREWAPTIEAARATIKTPEQVAAEKLAEAKRKLAEAEAEVVKLTPKSATPFNEADCGGVLDAAGTVHSDADP